MHNEKHLLTFKTQSVVLFIILMLEIQYVTVFLILVLLQSHLWAPIMFHSRWAESHTTPSGKIQYTGPLLWLNIKTF